MRFRALGYTISMISFGLAGAAAQARGFGGAGAAAGFYTAAEYGSYYNPSENSSLFSSNAYTPYGSEGSGASRAPIGVYGANQYGGTAANPVGAYTGYPAGLGSGGGGLRDFADFSSNSSARSGDAYLQSNTAWSQGGNWPTGQAARLPTDIGLSGSSAASTGGTAHSTLFMSRSAMASQARAVRGSFEHYNAFTASWFAANPRAWTIAPGSAFDAWATATAQTIAGWCGLGGPPQYFDYGNNVVLAEGHVFVNGADVGTAEQYAQQAMALASDGRSANASGPWMPLGVFALAQASDSTSNQVYELAIGKDGVIRGNFWEPVQNTNAVVYGKADKSNLRVAWSVGDSQRVVFETGLYNLTSMHTPLLVHFGTEKTRQWLLVRLDQPKAAAAGK